MSYFAYILKETFFKSIDGYNFLSIKFDYFKGKRVICCEKLRNLQKFK